MAWNSDRYAKLDECVDAQHEWRVWGIGNYGFVILSLVAWWFLTHFEQIMLRPTP